MHSSVSFLTLLTAVDRVGFHQHHPLQLARTAPFSGVRQPVEVPGQCPTEGIAALAASPMQAVNKGV